MPEYKGIQCKSYEFREIRDVAGPDSIKDFAPAAGFLWLLEHVFAELHAGADLGNRELMMYLSISPGDVFWISPMVGPIAENTTGQLVVSTYEGGTDTTPRYLMGLNVKTGAGAYHGLTEPIIMPYGWSMRVWDLQAIASEADNLNVVLRGVELKI